MILETHYNRPYGDLPTKRPAIKAENFAPKIRMEINRNASTATLEKMSGKAKEMKMNACSVDFNHIIALHIIYRGGYNRPLVSVRGLVYGLLWVDYLTKDRRKDLPPLGMFISFPW